MNQIFLKSHSISRLARALLLLLIRREDCQLRTLDRSIRMGMSERLFATQQTPPNTFRVSLIVGNHINSYTSYTFFAALMSQPFFPPAPSSLTCWSKEHIRGVFEAPSDDESLRTIGETFSQSLKGTLNGKPINWEDIKQLVMAMRKESRASGLKVEWKHLIEVPENALNQVCLYSYIDGRWSDPKIERVLCWVLHHPWYSKTMSETEATGKLCQA